MPVGNTNRKLTPAQAKALVKDTDGKVAHGDFSYNSCVDMMLYFFHSRQDIVCSVNFAACYMFCPRQSHELALKRIGSYLNVLHSKRFIFNPSSNLKIDCYPDSDFAGMYGLKKINDPTCVKSITSYVITVADWSLVIKTSE